MLVCFGVTFLLDKSTNQEKSFPKAVRVSILIALPAHVEKESINQSFYVSVAISGADAVSYFNEGKAVEEISEYINQ